MPCSVGMYGPPMDMRLREDDQVVLTATRAFNIENVDRDLVFELDDKSFYAETKKRSLMMVVFYLASKF